MNTDEIVFDPYSKDFNDNPYPIYKWLRDEAPVFFAENMNLWTISRYDDVLAGYRDFETFSSAGGVTIEGMDAGLPILLATDPPEHRIQKALITKLFSQQRMAELEMFIRNKVTSLLDEIADKDEFDFVQDFCLLLPLEVISELIGIPAEYRREIHDLTNVSLIRGEEAHDSDSVHQAQARAFEIYHGLVSERRAHPREDPITFLINSETEDDEGNVRRMSDMELAFRFSEMGGAGHETVAKAIPNGAMLFQNFPSERDKVISGQGNLRNAVEEILRFDPPSQISGRDATRDVILHGVTIPKGARVVLLTGAATRDERKFENPDVFDISRDVSIDAVYFGNGEHRCLGMHLARLEMRIAFEELFKRFPNFEVDVSRAVRPVLSNVRGLSHLPACLGEPAS